jgi:hypothetical protein
MSTGSVSTSPDMGGRALRGGRASVGSKKSPMIHKSNRASTVRVVIRRQIKGTRNKDKLMTPFSIHIMPMRNEKDLNWASTWTVFLVIFLKKKV